MGTNTQVTTDISKMKRVRELVMKEDQQLQLDLRSENMAGPRKGLYDDRPKENRGYQPEWSPVNPKPPQGGSGTMKLPKEEPMNALEYLSSKKDEEIASLRTFMFTVKILEDAKVTGKKLRKLPVSLLDFIGKYEEVYGALSKKKEEE